MRGCCAMPQMPRIANTANQTSMTGPNSPPTAAVPWRCIRKSTVNRTSEIGMTYGFEQRRRRDFQPLDRAQHRNRRGDGRPSP